MKQIGCKYCKSEYKDDNKPICHLKLPVGMLKGILDLNCTSDGEIVLQYAVGDDCNIAYERMDINYCPMCGRRLNADA